MEKQRIISNLRKIFRNEEERRMKTLDELLSKVPECKEVLKDCTKPVSYCMSCSLASYISASPLQLKLSSEFQEIIQRHIGEEIKILNPTSFHKEYTGEEEWLGRIGGLRLLYSGNPEKIIPNLLDSYYCLCQNYGFEIFKTKKNPEGRFALKIKEVPSRSGGIFKSKIAKTCYAGIFDETWKKKGDNYLPLSNIWLYSHDTDFGAQNFFGGVSNPSSYVRVVQLGDFTEEGFKNSFEKIS